MQDIIDAFLFDLDDTIIDSSIYAKIYGELIRKIVEVKRISEIELQRNITKLKQESGKERPDTFELCRQLDCIELYYEILGKYARHTYSLKTPAIPAIFRKIKEKKKRIGIVSNSEERTIKLFLDRFGLSGYVDFTDSGDKSTVLFWIQLQRKHSLDKDMTMVIDDSDEVLKVAEHSGYKVLNVRDLDIEKFSY